MPECFNSAPMEAAVIPLPNELSTPPVTKIYFVIIDPICIGARRIGTYFFRNYIGQRLIAA